MVVDRFIFKNDHIFTYPNQVWGLPTTSVITFHLQNNGTKYHRTNEINNEIKNGMRKANLDYILGGFEGVT